MTPTPLKEYTGLLVTIFIASLIILADLAGLLGWYKNLRSYILYPVSILGTSVSKNVSDTFASLFWGTSLKKDNLQLRTKVLELESYTVSLEKSIAEQKDFALYKSQFPDTFAQKTTAKILDLHADSLQGKLLLDQGSRAGIKIGMPVVLGSFYVGSISHVTPFESVCITYLIPNQEFVGYIQKRKITGIIKVGLNGMELGDLLASEQVALHDVVSIKRDGYPYFFTLGTISRTPTNNGSAERIATIHSSISLQDLSYVTIVKE